MRKNLVIYHRVDYDGIFSAIIVRKYYQGKGIITDLKGWNYGDMPLNFPEYIEKYQGIIIVDLGFSGQDMKSLMESGKITWIDHHQTSIQDSEVQQYDKIPGIRKIGIAACELCWKYFYPHRETPRIIQIVGAYDVWNKEKFDWEETTVPVQYGLRETYSLNLKSIETDWESLCNDQFEWITDTGGKIYSWIKRSAESWITNCSFEVTISETYKGIAIISPISGSLIFNSVLNKYDIFLVIQVINSGTGYSVSMYTEKDLPDFSCGEYLKKNYNGGGHKKAAGSMNITREQFERLIFEHKF